MTARLTLPEPEEGSVYGIMAPFKPQGVGAVSSLACDPQAAQRRHDQLAAAPIPLHSSRQWIAVHQCEI
jgi:hypothetical protein